jgi:hypothetical protein
MCFYRGVYKRAPLQMSIDEQNPQEGPGPYHCQWTLVH